MKLSREEVKHIAALSRLELTETEVEKFREQLSRILDFVEKLNRLNTDRIDPKFQVIPHQTVLREDIPAPGLPREKALQNAPNEKGGLFVVPKVVRKRG